MRRRQAVRISRRPARPQTTRTYPAFVPLGGGSGEPPANSFLTRRHGGGSPKVKEQDVGRSPRPTTLPTSAAALVAGPSASGVRASDPSQLNTESVLSPSLLSLDVGYERIHVDSRHLGVPRAFRGLEGTP